MLESSSFVLTLVSSSVVSNTSKRASRTPARGKPQQRKRRTKEFLGTKDISDHVDSSVLEAGSGFSFLQGTLAQPTS